MSTRSFDGQQVAKAPPLGEMYDLVRDYVKQETLDPIRGVGRWMAWAALGAVALIIGLTFVMVGLLRLTQALLFSEENGFTWVPYLVVVVISLLFVALSGSRIRKASLHAEKTRI